MLLKVDRLLLLRTEIDAPKGDTQNTIAQARDSLPKARDEDPSHHSEPLLQHAQALSRQGKPEEAAEAAQQVLRTQPGTPAAVEALVTLGISAVESEDLNAAENAFFQAAEQARLCSHPVGLAVALHNLAACVLVPRGKFDLALAYLEEARAVRADLGEKDWETPWLRAYVDLICGRRRRAREGLDEMVNWIEPATRTAGGYYFLWARLALDENDPEKAREYLRLGLRIATQTGVPDLNVWIRIEHSRYYRKLGQLPTAREWAEDAAHLAKRFEMRHLTALALTELAQACWENEDPLSAKISLEEAQAVFQGLGAAYDLAYTQYLEALWEHLASSPNAEERWVRAAQAISHGGYAFILEMEQEVAFPLIAAYQRSPNPAARQAAESLLQHLARVSPPALRVATLGQFSVWKGRQPIPDRQWQKRKAGELFRYLLLQPNRSSGREAILEALWPDYSKESSSDLLHQATSTLRRLLEPDLPDKFPSRYLSHEGEKIALQLPPGSAVDFEIFRQALPEALRENDPERLQDALNLYTGELFPAERYADWCGEIRSALAELYQEGLLALAAIHFKHIQFADALDCCRQVMRLDPWNEKAVLITMRCYLEMGAATHAMRIYLRLENTLRDDLGIQPDAELRQLAAIIRAR